MKSLDKTRHCAYCLNSISDESIKLCGKCKKRAYCSRDCQVTDWQSHGKGQGHKNWCSLECGEEDIDWKVCEINGKGLGLVAKRQLPAKYRIIVDGCRIRESDHPAIKDLMPANGTFEEKFVLNRLECDEEKDAICLRISRANHDCNPNADHWYDASFSVKVLYAQRDIAEGEEICINYQLHNDISRNISAVQARTVLETKWGIVCPESCSCYNKEMEQLTIKCRELDVKIYSLAKQGKSEEALIFVNELLKNHEIRKSSFLNISRTLYDGFQIAIMKKKTVKAAKKFIDEKYALQSAILSPESLDVKETQLLKNDFARHRNYLIIR